MAVEPFSSEINESRLVNNINQLIPWCASLVVQDEEEHLVQFAHHSVRDFLLSTPNKAILLPFHFQLRKANCELAEICVTYLSFDVFKKQVATVPQTRVPVAPFKPKSIIKTSVFASKSSIIYQSWLKLEKFLGDRSVHNADAWRELYSPKGDSGSGLVQDLQCYHVFLAYASEYWLAHTTSLTHEDGVLWFMWKRLVLAGESVAARPWTPNQWSSSNDIVKQYIVEQDHWALAILLQDCGCSLTATQRGSLILSAACDGSDQLIATLITGSDRLALLALDEAIRTAEQYKLTRVVERLLLVRVQIKYVVTGTLQTRKKRTQQYTVNAHGQDVDVNQNTSLGINVEKSIAVERLTDDFEQALRGSAASGDLATVVGLLNHDLRLDNVYVNAALHAAAQNGQLRIVEKLLNPEAGTNGISSFGQIALYIAAQYEHLDAVQTFIKAGIKVAPIGPYGENALHAAARNGNLEIVYELLKSNIDVNQITKNGFQVSDTMSMRALVRATIADTVKSSTFVDGCTALHLAAEHGHLEILKCLLEAGADCEILAYNGDGFFLAEGLALRQGHKEAATLLKYCRAKL